MRRRPAAGFTMLELLITAAVIGIIMAIGLPMMISALRAATLRAGAEEVASALSGARQLAISQNRNVCVTLSGALVQYRVGACTDPVTQQVRLSGSVTATSGGNVVFNFLGAATPAVTYTVTNPVDGRALAVQVLTSGRVRIQAS